MREDKQKICDLLLVTLQETRNGNDLLSLTFDAETEVVTGKFEGGGVRRINVACDSGTSMIRDIMNNLRFKKGW